MYPLIRDDLNSAVIVESDKVKVLLIGNFEAAEAMPLSPRLNLWNIPWVTGPRGKDFHADPRGQQTFDGQQHFRNGFSDGVRRQKMSRVIRAGQSAIEIKADPMLRGDEGRRQPRVKGDPKAKLTLTIDAFFDL
jgi:hypothetical protein